MKNMITKITDDIQDELWWKYVYKVQNYKFRDLFRNIINLFDSILDSIYGPI